MDLPNFTEMPKSSSRYLFSAVFDREIKFPDSFG